jgi:hypothetical protein
MALNSDLRNRVLDILSGINGSGEPIHQKDLGLTDIRNEHDRKYVRDTINALIALEPANTDIRIHFDFSQSVWVVWAEGYTGNIDSNYYAAMRNLMHGQMRGEALAAVYVPAKLAPLKFVVEINPSPVSEPPPRSRTRSRSVRRSHTPAPHRSRSPRRSVRRQKTPSPSSSPEPSNSASMSPEPRRYVPKERDLSPVRSQSRSPPPKRVLSLGPFKLPF